MKIRDKLGATIRVKRVITHLGGSSIIFWRDRGELSDFGTPVPDIAELRPFSNIPEIVLKAEVAFCWDIPSHEKKSRSRGFCKNPGDKNPEIKKNPESRR